MRPLDGIRVTDFTMHAAGPYASLMLGLLGAEVIRIESRARLDIQRRPHPVYGRMDVPTFDYLAGGKKAITLNLKEPRGLEIAKELIRMSDVVTENFRPGVMARLGIGPDVIRELHPQAVMVSLSSFGQTGPDSSRPGYAPVFAAEGGLGWLTGYPDGPPGEHRNLMDHQAGMTAALVAVSLLEERDRTGRGAYGDVAARDVAATLVGESLVEALVEGVAQKVGNFHEVWCPHQVYPAAGDDRWIAIAVRNDEEWAHLVEVMGSPGWCDDELELEVNRRSRREEIDERIGAWTATHDPLFISEKLQNAGVCAEVSMTAEDIINDSHLQWRGSVTELRHDEHGQRTTAGAPWRIADSAVAYDRWSPALGEHNQEVICDLLGHSKEELEAWIDEGVVR